MLPVVGRTRIAVGDREVWAACVRRPISIGLLVLKFDVLRVQEVRDDDFGLGADRDALAGLVDQAVLEVLAVDFDRVQDRGTDS